MDDFNVRLQEGVKKLTEERDAARAEVERLRAAIRTAFDELDMRHIEKHDEDTAHELRKLKWALESKEGGA